LGRNLHWRCEDFVARKCLEIGTPINYKSARYPICRAFLLGLKAPRLREARSRTPDSFARRLRRPYESNARHVALHRQSRKIRHGEVKGYSLL
jgi:hypothetical protein